MVKVLEKKFPLGYSPNMKSAGYYLHKTLKLNLDSAMKAVKTDWDMVIVIDGPEGSGKSVLAQQVAQYLDKDFSVDNITFTAEDFKNTILKSQKYGCVIFDEAFGGLSSRRAMSNTNHMLVNLFAEMRQRNLFVILVLPSFFELDKYAAIHRTRALIHVFHNSFQRGYYKFYSYKKKKIMYLHGKRNYDYGCVKSSFQGRFTNFYCVDKGAYKKKKNESLRTMLEDGGSAEAGKPKRQVQMEKAVAHFIKDLTHKEMESISLELGEAGRFLREFRIRNKKEISKIEESSDAGRATQTITSNIKKNREENLQ